MILTLSKQISQRTILNLLDTFSVADASTIDLSQIEGAFEVPNKTVNIPNFRQIAASASLPFYSLLERISIPRMFFRTDRLEAGETAIYDLSDGFEMGVADQQTLQNFRVQLQTETIAARSSITYPELATRKFEIVTRALRRGLIELAIAENRKFFQTLIANRSRMSRTLDFGSAIDELRRRVLVPHAFLLNPRLLSKLVAEGGFKIKNEKPIGFVGKWRGVNIYVNPGFPVHSSYLLPKETHAGGIVAERTRPEIASHNDPNTMSNQLVFWEDVSIAVIQPKNFVCISRMEI